MRYKIDKYYESDHFFVGSDNIDALNAYKNQNRETGGFLRSMLEGDLYRAATCSDINNQQRIYHIIKYIINNLPDTSYGSKEKVATWIRKY